jgi:hypothetical protein
LLRDGYPDWLLLKKGDTWNENIPNQWQLSGKGLAEKMLISSYGTGARPKIRTAGLFDNCVYFVSGTKGSHTAWVDLHFETPSSYPSLPVPTARCFVGFNSADDVLIEGCLFRDFDTAFLFQGGSNIVLRRNVLYRMVGQGSYIQNVTNLNFEENICADIANLWEPANLYRHTIYVDNEGNTGIVLNRNVVLDSSGAALYCRPGGTIDNNTVVRATIAIDFGGGDSWASNNLGVDGTITNNVLLDSVDLPGGSGRGWGISLLNVASATIQGNIMAHCTSATNSFATDFDGSKDGNLIKNVTYSGNVIYNWEGSLTAVVYCRGVPGITILPGGHPTGVDNIVFRNNEVTGAADGLPLLYTLNSTLHHEISSLNNKFSSQGSLGSWFYLDDHGAQSMTQYQTNMPDPSSQAFNPASYYPNADNATIADYYDHLYGGTSGTHDLFKAKCLEMRKGNWQLALTADYINTWIRAQFGK